MKKVLFSLLSMLILASAAKAQTYCFEELIDPFGGKNPGCTLPLLELSQGGAAIPIVRRVNGQFFIYLTHTTPINKPELAFIAPDKLEVITWSSTITLRQVRWREAGNNKLFMSIYVFELPAEAWGRLSVLTKARVKFSAIENDWPADWSAGLKTAREFFGKLK